MSPQVIVPVVPIIRTGGRPVTLPTGFWIALWGCTAAVAVVVIVWLGMGISDWWHRRQR